MTVGWDPAGDPTHSRVHMGRDTACAVRVLEMKRVVMWFTSHTRRDSHSHEKVPAALREESFYFSYANICVDLVC